MFNGTNGVSNGVSGRGSETLQWRMGLVNHEGKYLTAETFGFKLNASGTQMRKKQLWILEPDMKTDDVVYIKSHLNRYLSSDKKGNVTCDSEAKGETEKFRVGYDNDGKWYFQSIVHGYFFGGTEENLRCYEKSPTPSELWVARLAVHPQVCLRNMNRKRYAHLDTKGDPDGCIQCDEQIPWGEDALITLEYVDKKYAVRACDNRYLQSDGKLVPQPSSKTQYTLELRTGATSGLALKDNSGKYLTAIGHNAVMKVKNKTISKDELFTIEDSHPQVFITAHNGKKASIKQGVDLFCNQDELSNHETFQLEHDGRSPGKWRIRSTDNKYWKVSTAGGVQNIGDGSTTAEQFDIVHVDDGSSVAIMHGEKYVTARMNGSLYATSDCLDTKERFIVTVVNRPYLVLRGEYGFVAFKTAGSKRVECNKSKHDIVKMEPSGDGKYFLKGTNAMYWCPDPTDNTINASSPEPVPFIFEFRGLTRFSIKAPNGLYLKGEQNGTFSASSSTVTKDCLWEY